MTIKADLRLKEKNIHGDFLLPIQKYYCIVPDHFSLLPLHWHEELEFTLIRKGQALYHINLEAYEVHEGDLMIIPPFILHDIHQQPSHTMTLDTFVFNLNMLNLKSPDACSIKYLMPLFNGQYTIPYIISPQMPYYNDFLSLFDTLNTHYEKQKEGFELSIKASLFHLFALLFSHGLVVKENPLTFNNPHTEKLKLVLDYIHEHIKETITIKQLAHLCHFSEYYFMNFFKKHTGMTTIEYINTQRLELATTYLRKSNLPIMDIALEVGFDHISYFNKLFKLKYGTTPKNYRIACKSIE